jgi:hypothetical protein
MNIVGIIPSVLTWLSGVAFIGYGFLCLFSGGMTEEFDRYNLPQFRRLVGLLELLGGLGSIVGILFYLPLLVFSSAGLALLMFLGVIVRIRTKDRFVDMTPAIALTIINIYISKVAIGLLS